MTTRNSKKHCIMVQGHGENADVLQATVDVLDSEGIDFAVHWDAKYPIPELHAEHSKIDFLPDRIKVVWGGVFADSSREAPSRACF